MAQKKGELFCSRHGSDVNTLKSGVFYINTNTLEECDWHVTRLSLNFNLDTRQTYRTPAREYTVSPEKYLLLNEGQSFTTFSTSDIPNRMVTIAFQVGLADSVMQGLWSDEKQLLDEPFITSEGRTHFLEKTYPMDAVLFESVKNLTALEDKHALDFGLETLLLYILKKQLNVRREILSIKKSKTSTRLELYKRLHWSMDYLHENFASDITVEQLATIACLSTFHYKRLFAELFHVPPHQYLIRVRLEKACSLLQGDWKVSDVCRQVGWRDPSSFARLFKRHFAMSPDQYRNRARFVHR